MVRNSKTSKRLSQAIQKELSKVIHFPKFLKIKNTDSRFLPLVKLQTGSSEQLFYTKMTHQGCFLGNLRIFPEHLDIIDCRGKCFVVPKATLY